MLVKRFLNSKRDKSAIVTQLALPLIFTLIALVIAKTAPAPTNSDPRGLFNLAGLCQLFRIAHV